MSHLPHHAEFFSEQIDCAPTAEIAQPLPGQSVPATVGASSQTDCVAQAKNILTMEAQAIFSVATRISSDFEKAVNLLLKCTGKVVVTGIGKSGHIGSKIAATFASTGTPAFFVHPAELRHGDFGMLDEKDVVVLISGSGETPEIKLALDPIKRLGVPVIALTGNLKSTVARVSDVVLDVTVEREACPLNLAPTSSTTVALAMGDALAITLMTKKNFKVEDFARSHPGGSLGRQLITVRDIMRWGVEVPTINLNANYKAILSEISGKKLGFTAVLNDKGELVGIITDGDLRRAQVRWGQGAFQKLATDVMSSNPKTIAPTSLATEALKLMDRHAISDLLIVDEKRYPIGLIDLKDLLKAGII